MIAEPLERRRSVLSAALAELERFLLVPEEEAEAVAVAPPPPRRRPVVAVIGVSAGCGTTTIARALAVELAGRDECRAAAITAGPARNAVPLASSAAARLARDLGVAVPCPSRPAGRLCLTTTADLAALTRATRHRAPLALDVPYGDPAACPASLADHVVLVAASGTEPALVSAVVEALDRAGPEPVVVVNRAIAPSPAPPEAVPDRRGETGAGSPGALAMPESALGARLALAGRGAPGAFAEAIAALADRCEDPG